MVPSLLTLGNAACGFASITLAANMSPEKIAEGGLYMAGLLIFIAMAFDALDGPVARLAKQTSDFGAQLDSMCDAVSFGVAPAFLMLKFSPQEFAASRILWAIAVLYVLCALLRLARFNLATDSGEASHSSPN